MKYLAPNGVVLNIDEPSNNSNARCVSRSCCSGVKSKVSYFKLPIGSNAVSYNLGCITDYYIALGVK